MQVSDLDRRLAWILRGTGRPILVRMKEVWMKL